MTLGLSSTEEVEVVAVVLDDVLDFFPFCLDLEVEEEVDFVTVIVRVGDSVTVRVTVAVLLSSLPRFGLSSKVPLTAVPVSYTHLTLPTKRIV